MDCIVHWVTKSQTQLSNFHFRFAIDKHNLAPIYKYFLFFFFFFKFHFWNYSKRDLKGQAHEAYLGQKNRSFFFLKGWLGVLMRKKGRRLRV